MKQEGDEAVITDDDNVGGEVTLDSSLSGATETNDNEVDPEAEAEPSTTVPADGENEEEPQSTNKNTGDDDEGAPTENQEASGSESDIIEVPANQTVSIGGRRIIKVPCNGSARPDRTGVCRNVW